MNDDVRDCVDNPLVYKEGIFRTILDGEYYKENSFFKENANALAIVLYMDELGVANPLASSSKTQKLTMFYWTLANINPNLRSSQNAIQLLAIVKSCYLKQPGALNKVLKPFIDDIKNLQTQGINVTINGVPKNYKGSLLFFSGDTPASALMGGFKESVSAHRPCRTCMFTKDEIKQHVRETDFLLRNKDTHQEHLEAINDNTTQATKNFWQLFYGINTVSPLADIPFFDVTMCLPQDCMHVLNEGVTELLNEQLTAFEFGHFSRDKPAIIQNNDLADDKKLRQSAAQMFVLAHTLPFLIGQWIYNSDDEGVTERLDCLILLLQIMNLCLAYEIHDDSIDTLSQHIPRYIKLFGPARQQWCFRFEAAHAYFKALVAIVRSFKNMPDTMCYRYQSRMCSRLFVNPGQSSKTFLYEGDNITPGPSVLLVNLPYKKLFDDLVNDFERSVCSVMRSPKVTIHSTSYSHGSVILLECNEEIMPIFAEIDDICILNSQAWIATEWPR
ncbi:uncharacterized protein LOC128667833 [Microplitis demolitor]|uniref:uncharacterized protein LOC128667833 n=1 Tax=Microplitis demolitor TaxID=69319 RepID=UPI00235B6700|nr:uncharacterized protein LOC128667833 [Microplitis demolitor]